MPPVAHLIMDNDGAPNHQVSAMVLFTHKPPTQPAYHSQQQQNLLTHSLWLDGRSRNRDHWQQSWSGIWWQCMKWVSFSTFALLVRLMVVTAASHLIFAHIHPSAWMMPLPKGMVIRRPFRQFWIVKIGKLNEQGGRWQRRWPYNNNHLWYGPVPAGGMYT